MDIVRYILIGCAVVFLIVMIICFYKNNDKLMYSSEESKFIKNNKHRFDSGMSSPLAILSFIAIILGIFILLHLIFKPEVIMGWVGI